MVRFRSVYEKLSEALNGMPSDELGISEEEKEQVELMCMQMRRAKTRADSQDMELAMDMMMVLSSENDWNANSACIERLANKLGLRTVESLNAETAAVRKFVKEKRGHNVEATLQVLDILNKFKGFAGIEFDEENVLDDPVEPKALDKCQSLAIPNGFLCPITLEIMTDPVIVSTGQTYERESIQQWLDSDHRTCPKWGQLLTHFTSTKFRIEELQWCEKNNFELPKQEVPPTPTPSSPEKSSITHDEKMLSLVAKSILKSVRGAEKGSDKYSQALSRESREQSFDCQLRIPPLVQLLSYLDSKIQEHAVTALLNLSINESNKILFREGPIPPVIEILQNGTIGAKENSAEALFSLSMLDENKAAIGALNGIPPLVELLRSGTIGGKKDAVTALFNLVLGHANKSRAIEARIMAPLLQILKDNHLDMVDETLSILLLLSSHPDGRQEIGQLAFIQTLVDFIKEGTPKNKDVQQQFFLSWGTHNSDLLLAVLQYGVYEQISS